MIEILVVVYNNIVEPVLSKYNMYVYTSILYIIYAYKMVNY